MYTFEPDNFNIGLNAKDVSNQNTFFIQTSLLYTTESRQRMLRIHNYGVRMSKDQTEIYSAIDYQSVIASLLKRKIPNFISQIALIDIQLEIINDFKKAFKSIAGQTSSDLQSTTLPFLALGFLGVLKCSILQSHYINNCGLISQK